MAGQIVRNKMAEAMENARAEFTRKGGNPGRIGHRILTNNARGVGSRIMAGGSRQDKKS